MLVREDGPAVRVTLNRPEKRNALSLELVQELLETLERVGAGTDARAIVRRGCSHRRTTWRSTR